MLMFVQYILVVELTREKKGNIYIKAAWNEGFSEHGRVLYLLHQFF